MIRRFGACAGLTCAGILVTARPAAADFPGAGIVKDAGAAFSGWAWDKVTEGLTKWILGAVANFVEGVVGFMADSSRIDLGAVWFSGSDSPYATVRGVAITMTLGFALVGIVSGAVRGDVNGMLARVGAGLPLTALAMAVVIPAASVALELVDALSVAVLDPAKSPGMHFLRGFGATAAAATGGFAVVVLGLVAGLAALALWAELLVRAAFVYLLIALSPMVFAATLWPAARGILRRAAEIFTALVVSKFVISVAIAVGVAALGGAGDHGESEGTAASVGTLLVGTAILAVAAFSPFLVLRLLPILETATLVQGVSRSPARLTQAAVTTTIAARSVGRLSGAGAGAAASGGATVGVGPSGGGGGAPGPSPSAGAPHAAASTSAATRAPEPSHERETHLGSAPPSSRRRPLRAPDRDEEERR